MNFETSIHNGQIQIRMIVQKSGNKIVDPNKTTIKFFDSRHKQGQSYQFISEYYIDTFLKIPSNQHLNMAQDCCEEWFLLDGNIIGVQRWLNEVVLAKA